MLLVGEFTVSVSNLNRHDNCDEHLPSVQEQEAHRKQLQSSVPMSPDSHDSHVTSAKLSIEKFMLAS